MAAVGYHRAPRSAGATWIRIVLALALVIPAMASVAGPATAVVPLPFALLKDLNSSAADSDPGGDLQRPVASGAAYYFVADPDGDELTSLYRSEGSAATTSVVTVAGVTEVEPHVLTAFDDGLLFFADATGEGDELFWTNGTTASRVAPPTPAGTSGFWNIGSSIVTIGTAAYFTGSAYRNAGSGDPASVWQITAASGHDFSLTDTIADWSFDEVEEPQGNTPVGLWTQLGVFGTKLYAGLIDCYAPLGTPCTTGHGLEMWIVDTASSPDWALLRDGVNGMDGTGGLPDIPVPLGATDSRFYYYVDVEGGSQYIWSSDGLQANTALRYSSGTPNNGVYGKIAFDELGSPLAGALDSVRLIFVTNLASTAYVNVIAGGAPINFGGTCDAGALDSLAFLSGSAWYACDAGAAGKGIELTRLRESAGSPDVTSFDVGTGSQGAEPRSITAFQGALYFAGNDPEQLTDVEMLRFVPDVYTAPEVAQDIALDPAGSAPFGVAAASDRLIFWASESATGIEPYISKPTTLTVGGAGTGVVADGNLLNCAITDGTVSGTCVTNPLPGMPVTLISIGAYPPSATALATWGGVTCAGAGQSQSSPDCTFTVDAAATNITATFGALRTLTVVPDGGSGEVDGLSITDCTDSIASPGDCGGEYGQGATIVLTASNYSPRSLRWASGCTSNPTPSTCSITFGASNVTVSILFGYSVTVTVVNVGSTGSDVDATTPANGISNCTSSGGAGCTAVYADPGNVTLTATPNAGATVLWSGVTCAGAGESQTTNACTFAMGGAAKSPTVTFTASGGGGGDTWDLTVTKDNSASGSGTVTSNTGIRCGASCPSGSSFALADETDVVLTAKAAKGSIFTGWDGVECDEPSQTGSTCSFTLSDADETDVTAAFELLRKLTVTKTGVGAASATIVSSAEDFALGSISCGSACSASYADGTEVVLTAYLGTGSTVVTWTGCTSSDATTCTVNMLSGAKTVTVEISGPTGGPYYSLAIVNRTGLTITSDTTPALNCGPTCSVSVVGGSVTLAITEVPTGSQPTGSGLTWTQSGMTSTWTVTFTLSANTTIRVRLARI